MTCTELDCNSGLETAIAASFVDRFVVDNDDDDDDDGDDGCNRDASDCNSIRARSKG